MKILPIPPTQSTSPARHALTALRAVTTAPLRGRLRRNTRNATREPFWFGGSPWRVIAETLLIMVTLSLVVYLTAERGNPRFYLLQFAYPLLFLDGPFCAMWCAARLRVPKEAVWWRWGATEVGVGAILSAIPAAILAIAVLILAVLTQHNLADTYRGVPYYAYMIGACSAAFVGLTFEFLIFRVIVRLLLFWNSLRRRHMRWALTHALLTVAAIGAGLISLFFISLFLYLARGPGRDITTLLPITYFLLIMSAIGLLLILPPSALFSMLFARGVTQRLKSLITAANALRAGDYSMRTPVQGEDEIAQLQTDFNAMAAELQRAVKDLKTERDTVAALLGERRELVASVSHELRTPVATLRSYLESSLVHWPDEAMPAPTSLRRDVEIMERETVRLQSLIDDLFALARAEVGRLDLHPAPTDLGLLISRIVETAGPVAWRGSRVEMVAEAPLDLPLALVDSDRLEQVIHNLLRNSVRHTPPGGIISVSASLAQDGQDAAALRVQVRDTGEGIASGDLPRVWDRFYQSEHSRMQAGGGAGLGLALVRELTEAMGGAVSVESVVGAGSCFTLRLPLAPATLLASISALPSREKTNSPNLRPAAEQRVVTSLGRSS
ncbi:MAG: HAMP domain-containing sensor histidine kinase [Ktedonobacterales bacterium]